MAQDDSIPPANNLAPRYIGETTAFVFERAMGIALQDDCGARWNGFREALLPPRAGTAE